ncbi:hypothetical protein FJY63_03285, partial [Candidatus Sumerlaeota bacterium]|nr:hypothetical protein [Candidatus Sumerlaeota bacterium]
TIYWRAYEGQFLGPVFLLWLPLLLRVLMDAKHRTPRQGSLRIIVFFALAYCAVWYFTYQSNRLLIPALALLSVLVAYSLAVVGQTARWIAKVACVVLLAASVYNIEWAASWIVGESGGPDLPAKPSAAAYLLGFQSRDSYLRQAFPPYAVFQQMPDHVAKGEKVLFVGDYRACHCPVEWLASDWFDTPLLVHYIRSTSDNDSLLDRLLDQGVRWIFYNDAEWARYENLFFAGGYERLILDSDKQVALKARFTAEEKARYLGLFRRDKSGAVVAHPRLNAVAMQKDPQIGLWMILYEIRQKAEGKRQKLE